jgi:pRiA4b ORF-3-like protein
MELQGVDPAVWRRLLVPGGVRLSALSAVLLATMGWTDSHLHAFQIGPRRYVSLDDDDLDFNTDDEVDETDVTVADVLGPLDVPSGQPAFLYQYDFGDDWEHEVVIEQSFATAVGLKFAVCLDGANACPPENVGGTHRYRDFVAAISDPGHPEHRALLDWVGGSFDPTAFDLATTNAVLQRLK